MICTFKRLLYVVLSGILLVAGCGVLEGNDKEDEPMFGEVDQVTFFFDQTGDEPDVELVAQSIDGGDSLIVRDRLQLAAGAQYLVSIRGRSPEKENYLTTAGPSAVLFYQKMGVLDTALTVQSVSVSTRPLHAGSKSAARIDYAAAQTRSSGKQTGTSTTAPADIFRFELTTDNTQATGSLRLQLARYRKSVTSTPDHIDFDVFIPVRIDERQ